MKTRLSTDSRTRLLDAALQAIRERGYAATSVDDICRHAGLSKGSFFHHFASKEALAVAAARHFSAMAQDLFAAAPYHDCTDPVDRLLGYVDFRAALLDGALHDTTCLLGTMVQETYASHPDIRQACDQGMSDHIAALMRDIEAAKARYAADARWSAESLGLFMQSVLQGAFIFAKARQGPDAARQSLAHLRAYLASLFPRPVKRQRRKERP